MALQEEMILRVDFNAVDDNGRLPALLRYAMGAGRPEVGEWVWLMDGDGNGCLGRVVQVNGDLVEVEPNWSTWNPPLRIIGQYPVSYSEWFFDPDEPVEDKSSVRPSAQDRPNIQV